MKAGDEKASAAAAAKEAERWQAKIYRDERWVRDNYRDWNTKAEGMWVLRVKIPIITITGKLRRVVAKA